MSFELIAMALAVLGLAALARELGEAIGAAILWWRRRERRSHPDTSHGDQPS